VTSIYQEAAEWVKAHGERVDYIAAPRGLKPVYRAGRFIVVLDPEPRRPEEGVVAVMRDKEMMYVCLAVIRGSRRLGLPFSAKELSGPKLLAELLNQWRREAGP
jgi:hypothetical protein